MFVHDRLDPNERFRQRRRLARRRYRLRRLAALAVLLSLVAGIALGASYIGKGGKARVPVVPRAKAKPAVALPRPLPAEVRGVHVTAALASLPGKLDEYLKLQVFGLNTLELDVKDENGQVGFYRLAPRLARETGAAQRFYSPRVAARKVHARGMYLIGRVVVFEDPILAENRPDLAIRNPDGTVWHNRAGLGWVNPYDRRVWDYNVSIAQAAARAGFDEIQFDYVRFPSDGNVTEIVYPGRRAEPKGQTIADFLAYAARRLRPLGVRVSADVFGLAAKHDLRVGQVPRRIARVVDTVYPMVYPSHYNPGEYNLDDPNAAPGLTVALSLRDFKLAARGSGVKIIPWLQDFSLGRPYTVSDVADQIAAARRAGARGFMLWNPVGVYTRSALEGR